MGSETINYYNKNASAYASTTQNIDLSNIYEEFLSRLDKGSLILDFGCGSGRDSKYFLESGYKVEAIDGSIELCKLASKYIGIQVKNILFNELNEVEKYDAIWACSSLLHLTTDELKCVLMKIFNALKDNGIAYMSFKYGNYEGIIDNRYYTYFNEDSFKRLIETVKGFEVEKIWLTKNENLNVNWLNIIIKKMI